MVRFRFAALAVSAGLAALTLGTVPARAAMDDAQRQAIEQVVRDYLMKNPEVIVEAIEELQKREKLAEDTRNRQALSSNRAALENSAADPVLGNPKGDVTLVEFFDYQCGYCKAVQADVQKLIKEDAKLRVVFKEFPILGPASVTAAKAALASREQGKYEAFHNALMAHRGQLDDDTILRLARSAGLDTDKLKKDMESPAVQQVIGANLALAQALGIRGTPAFVVGDDLAPGAIKLNDMKAMVAKARKG